MLSVRKLSEFVEFVHRLKACTLVKLQLFEVKELDACESLGLLNLVAILVIHGRS